MKIYVKKRKVTIYYDNEYNIGKITIMKDGHEEYLSEDDKIYKMVIAEINLIGGSESYIKILEKQDYKKN